MISMVRRPAVTISFGGASIGGGLVPGVGQRGFDPRGLRCDWEQPGWGRYRDTLSPTVASSVGDKRRQLPAEPTSGGVEPAALPCGAVSARRRRGTPHLSQKGSETNGRICCSPGRQPPAPPRFDFCRDEAPRAARRWAKPRGPLAGRKWEEGKGMRRGRRRGEGWRGAERWGRSREGVEVGGGGRGLEGGGGNEVVVQVVDESVGIARSEHRRCPWQRCSGSGG